PPPRPCSPNNATTPKPHHHQQQPCPPVPEQLPPDYEGERVDENPRDGEEERGEENLAALHFDREVFPQEEERNSREDHAITARYRARSPPPPAGSSDTRRPSRTIATRVTRPSPRSRSCVASTT